MSILQRCPACNGTGLDSKNGGFNKPQPKCTVCDGTKIISILDGKPPKD